MRRRLAIRLVLLALLVGSFAVAARADTIEDLVRAARATEDPDLAIGFLREASELLDPEIAGHRGNLAFLWNEISVLERERGNHQVAVDAAARAVRLASHVPANPARARYSLNLGLAAFDLLDFDTARDALAEAVEIAALAGSDAVLVPALRNLGVVQLVAGDYGAAEATFDEALTQLGPGPDPQSEIAILQPLARTHLMQRNPAAARTVIDRVLALQAGLDSPVEMLESRILAGRVALQEGRFDEARNTLESVRDEAAAIGSSADAARASALYNLAEIDFMRGRFSEADTLNEEAERIFSEVLGRNHYLTAQTIHRRAAIYQEIGDAETAIDLYVGASERFERLFAPDHPLALSTAIEHSRALALLGRNEDAIARAREVLARFDPVREDLLYDRSLAMAALGLALHGANRDDEAREVLEAAMALREGRDMPTIDEPPGWNALAEIYLAQGDMAAARNAIDRSIAILNRTEGITVDRLGESRRILAEIERSEGNHGGALALIRENLAAATDRLRELSRQASYASEFAPAALRRQVGQALQVLWQDGAAMADARAEMFVAAQLVHLDEITRATNGLVGRLAGDDGHVADLLTQRRQLTEDIRGLGGLIAAQGQDPNATDPTGTLARIADLRARKLDVDTALAEAAPDLFSDLMPEPVGVEAVRSALAPGEAFWMQVTLDRVSFLFLVTVDGLSVARSDYGALDLQTDVARVRASVEIDNFPDLPPFAFDAAARLFDRLFAPVAGSLGTIRTLIVVPDLAAQQIPLGTLVRDDPAYGPEFGAQHARWRFLGLTHGIAVVPSPMSWLRLRRSSDPDSVKGGFVGFGNPVLRGTGEIDSGSLSRAISRSTGLADPDILAAIFEPLPETEDELRLLATRHAPGNRRLFLQRDATEAVARAIDYGAASVVAFATHAIVSGDFDHLSEPALVLTPPDMPSPSDDGLLTTSEIARLNIDADMVVLSACNTGSSSGRPGAPGLSGLASGFFRAGAKSLVVSHWTILSASSLVIMPKLFGHRASGDAPSEALRRTMLQVANTPAGDFLAHPGVWAPFSVIGDR